MKYYGSVVLDKNPIDNLCKLHRGMPDSFKEYLALYINPRPAGVVLMGTTPKEHQFPWAGVQNSALKVEAKYNSGNYIAVLLRHPAVATSPDFISIFDRVEVEYKAILKRAKWLSPFASNEKLPIKAVQKIAPALEELEERFSDWFVSNRNLVVAVLSKIAEQDIWRNGNAKKDLERNSISFE
ncbi:hypothetical protein [Teredinibacter purpureus]|uniref:hypothetical protein n=1 Tax=Teredinibacter purpureus TaxID=2731756 RepID=UPI0005F875E6|nr:hypothetical protein [Teredinibacter purpureus]